MKVWLALTILGFVAVQSAKIPTCPVNCECIVSRRATCTSLEIEPFASTEILSLTIKSPAKRLDLTASTFTNLRLTKLHELVIENATIAKLEPSLFNVIPLERFIVRHASIPTINKTLFKSSLRLVDISYCNISNFEGIHAPFLKELVLAHNGFKSLPERALTSQELPALTYMSLEDNELTTVELGDLAGEEINLSGNKITSIMIDLDGDEDDLKSLKLDRNPLTKIETLDDVEIDELYVNDCQLTTLDFLQNFTALSKLEANNNKIEKLDAALINEMDQLEVLHLKGNRITELPKDFGRVLSLTSLILDNNKLKTFPKFMFQGALDIFSCNNCDLENVHPETFVEMRATRVISLVGNKLKSLPQNVFEPVVSLSKLDLSNNQLTLLPLFDKNEDLKYVDISGNPLKVVDPAIFSKTPLQELHMSSCGLKTLWAKSDKVLPKLQTLVAMHNEITEITQKDTAVMPKIAELNIQDNPLPCTTKNIDMILFLDDKNVKYIHNNDCNIPDFGEDDESYYNNSLDYNDPEVQDDQSNEKLLNPTYDDDDDDDYNDQEQQQVISEKTKKVSDTDIDDEDDDEEEDEEDEAILTKQQRKDQFLQDAADVKAIDWFKFQEHQRNSKQMLLFVLPTLVFVLTAMVVLLLTVTVILCIMQRRNGRRTNAPQINIIPWNNPKIKKHSGSIYRPLSEEKIPV